MVVHPENYISLYSGGGGLDLGFRLANPDARPVLYVEREFQAAALLVDHIEAGLLEPAPVWSDSGTLDCEPFAGRVDWIIGGFPCQPWSPAGKRKGLKDPRWLWPHIARIVREVRPRGLFLENVPPLISGGGLAEVLRDLAACGFDAEWDLFRAADVGAPHRRERVFIMAYRSGSRRQQELRSSHGDEGANEGRASEGSYLAEGGDRELGDASIGRSEVGHDNPSRQVAVEGRGQLAHTGHDAGRSELGQQHSIETRGDRESGPRVDDTQSTRAGIQCDNDRTPTGQSNSPEHASVSLADSDSRSGDLRQRGEREPERSESKLGDTEGIEQRNREAWARESSSFVGSGGNVVDTNRQGPQERVSNTGMGRTESSRYSRPFAFPPGPSDTDAWATVDERYWPATESRIRHLAHGLAGFVARYGIELFGETINANDKTSANEVVRCLRTALEKKAHEWSLGRLLGVPTQKALLTILCEYERQRNEVGASLESTEITESAMRIVWSDDRITRPSRGWTTQEQRSKKHPDPMHALSRLLAQRIGKAWETYQRENAAALGFGLSRTARLRILGNGVVPQQAALAFRSLATRMNYERLYERA